MGQIYQVTKQLSGKKAQVNMPIKDKNNNTLTTFSHILWNTECKVSAARTESILKSSAFSWSVPGAFLEKVEVA
jgi:hypothetical protein